MRFTSLQLPSELEDWRVKIEGWAREVGLDFYQTIFEVLDWNQMNMVAAYGGFPNRYPHWRFGMEYDQLAKSYAYGLSKIYEMVINNDPCYAYLLHCNKMTDQKMVMAHVFGHCDFFKNNIYFASTPKNMMNQMANHKTKVVRLVDKLGFDTVESFVDVCLSVDNLIDPQRPFLKPKVPEEKGKEREPLHDVKRLRVDKDYLESYINPTAFLESQKKRQEEEDKQEKRFPVRPERDVMGFLLAYAPLERWEYDVLDIVRKEAYYFAPQGQTKIMNEGWACVKKDTPVFTERGLITMGALVAGEAGQVHDGDRTQNVYDRNIIRDHPTVTVRTRRGLVLGGSNNHCILLGDRLSWRRLDELNPGDEIAVSGGGGMWGSESVAIDFKPAERVGLADVAECADVSLWTVLRHRAGKRVRAAVAVTAALADYDDEANQNLPLAIGKRRAVRIPQTVDESVGALLGYLVGDGHISRVKRHFGLTTGDREQAETFAALGESLFGVRAISRIDGRRWRVLFHSEHVADLLTGSLGLTHGPSARVKIVPACILKSPEPVVRAFLRAYFDCDGHAGKQGVILSTASAKLGEQIQLLLLNYGILSRRRLHRDGCWHVHVTGPSAAAFARKIGFGLARKQRRLEDYVAGHSQWKGEAWSDEIVAIECGVEDVYDISVTETHRYAAGGFINHNSYWHSHIMTRKAMTADEVIDFADHHSGTMAMSGMRLNPYKIGIELFRHIEERWDHGRFGKDYDECDDLVKRKNWDRQTGLGRQKIFAVRQIYNDVTFLDEFFTTEFCRDYKLFAYTLNPITNRYEISDRDFKVIKQKILVQLTNMGQPTIEVIDANHGNRAELLLKHVHEGVDLDLIYAQETLKNLYKIWRRPVLIESKVNNQIKIHKFDGDKHQVLDSQSGL